MRKWYLLLIAVAIPFIWSGICLIKKGHVSRLIDSIKFYGFFNDEIPMRLANISVDLTILSIGLALAVIGVVGAVYKKKTEHGC